MALNTAFLGDGAFIHIPRGAASGLIHVLFLSSSEDGRATVSYPRNLFVAGENSQLTVVETGFETTSDPAANLESHRQGWDAELDKLVALFESGS